MADADSSTADFEAFLDFGASQLRSKSIDRYREDSQDNVQFDSFDSEPNITDRVLISNTTDRVLTSNYTDRVLTSNITDPVLTSNTIDPVLTSNTIDPVLISNITDRVLKSNGMFGFWPWVRTGTILIILTLFIGLAVLKTDISKSPVSVPIPYCTYAGTRTSLKNIVPLPHKINYAAHEPLLDELHDLQQLIYLTNTQSSVSSSVRATNRELTTRLTCSLKSYSRIDDNNKEAGFALIKEITLIHGQTNYTASNASRLYNLYSSIKPAYYKYISRIAEALEAAQIDDRRDFLVSAQPLILKWFGFDFKEMYWDPWVEKEEMLKKAQSAIHALEKESERVEKIEQVTQEIGRNLKHLAVTVIEKDAQTTRDDGSLLRQGLALIQKGRRWQVKGGESGENWVKEWFRQHVASYVVQDEGPLTNSQFDTWWTNLDCWCGA